MGQKGKRILVVAEGAVAGRLSSAFDATMLEAVELVTVAGLAEAKAALADEDFAAVLIDVAAAAPASTPLAPGVPVIVFDGQSGDSAAIGELSQAVALTLATPAAPMTTDRPSLYDAYSGLPTRTLLVDRVNQAVARAQRNGGHVAVVPFTLGGLDCLHERFDRQAADSLFRAVLGRLIGSVRGTDTVAHLGGSDFAILMETRNGHADAVLVAERIREIMTDTLVFDVGKVDIEMTIRGPVMCDEPIADLGPLLRRAERPAVSQATGGPTRPASAA